MNAGNAANGENAELTWRTVVLRCLAIVSAVCAVIHFAVAGSHYQEYWAFGAFMLGAAFLQSLLADRTDYLSAPSSSARRSSVAISASSPFTSLPVPSATSSVRRRTR